MGNPLLEMLFEAEQTTAEKKRRREEQERQHQADILAAEEELDQARAEGDDPTGAPEEEEDIPEEVLQEEDPEAQPPEEEAPPADNVGDPSDMSDLPDFDGSESDFSLDDDTDIGGGDDGTDEDGLDTGDMTDTPAPDGLPEADAEGDGSMPDAMPPEEDAEPVVQTTILQLSKLDRALAKDYIYHQIADLRSTVNSVLSVIDVHEARLDPEVREKATEDLNMILAAIKKYLKYKFQIVSYEEATSNYIFFVQQINDIIEKVKNEGLDTSRNKHNNKNDPS